MTKDDIIRMAREAGFATAPFWPDDFKGLHGCAERFANLVATAERESCALLAQQFGSNRPIVAAYPSRLVSGRWEGEQAASAGIANAIRARSKS